jgi:hypothetical protein
MTGDVFLDDPTGQNRHVRILIGRKPPQFLVIIRR